MNRKAICRLVLVICGLLILVSCSDPDGSGTGMQLTEANENTKAAPDFTLTNLQGKQVSLSDYKGKVVILNFWATWCGPCREEMPSMEAMHRKLSDQGLVLLAVNVDKDAAALKELMQEQGYTFTVLVDKDSKVQSLYQVYRFPESYIIDRNGQIVDKVIGAINWNSEQAFKFLNFLLNG